MTSSLISNPKVKHVKMTGSYPTAVAIHNTIRKSRPHLSESEVHEMFVSELGNVTPWIISPGKYSERELRNAADYIVVAKNLFGGCNCLNAQAVVLPSGWKQKDEFKKLLFERFQKTSIDPLYYPGSDRLVQKIVDHYAGTDAIRQIAGPTMDRSGDVHDSDIVNPYVVDCGTFGEDGYDNFALTNEAFGPVLALVELSSDGDSEDGKYLTEQAVPFVNNKDNIFGSLSCSLLYPSSQKDSIEIKEATGALNYGCVGHNTWTAVGFFSMSYGGIWGGSKFEPLGQSGRGTGGNFYHIKNLEKSVVYSKSLSFPPLISKDTMPPAFVSNAMSALALSRTPKRIIQKMLKLG
jgi:aldehyde dehydrogenase (NAD(P)+)